MNTNKRWIRSLIGCLLSVLIAGCAAAATETVTKEPTAIPTKIPTTTTEEPEGVDIEAVVKALEDGIKVTFDGTDCSVSGPTELLTGNYTFVLKDLSDLHVDLWVSRLVDGKTFQDLLNEQSEPGVWSPKPRWVEYDDQVGLAKKQPEGEETWVYSLEEEGEHFIYVGQYTPKVKTLWYCVPVMVMEPTSE